MAEYPIGTSYSQTVAPLVFDSWVGDVISGTNLGTTGQGTITGVFGAGSRIVSVALTGQTSLSPALGLYAADNGTLLGTLYTALGTTAVPGASLGALLSEAAYLRLTSTFLQPAQAVVTLVRMA